MISEKQIEKTVCKYAEDKGFWVRKFTSPSHVGVPDRIFCAPNGFVFFIEFKKNTDCKLSPCQAREIQRMQTNNMAVWVIGSIEDGKRLIDSIFNKVNNEKSI